MYIFFPRYLLYIFCCCQVSFISSLCPVSLSMNDRMWLASFYLRTSWMVHEQFLHLLHLHVHEHGFYIWFCMDIGISRMSYESGQLIFYLLHCGEWYGRRRACGGMAGGRPQRQACLCAPVGRTMRCCWCGGRVERWRTWWTYRTNRRVQAGGWRERAGMNSISWCWWCIWIYLYLCYIYIWWPTWRHHGIYLDIFLYILYIFGFLAARMCNGNVYVIAITILLLFLSLSFLFYISFVMCLFRIDIKHIVLIW